MVSWLEALKKDSWRSAASVANRRYSKLSRLKLKSQMAGDSCTGHSEYRRVNRRNEQNKQKKGHKKQILCKRKGGKTGVDVAVILIVARVRKTIQNEYTIEN